VAVRFDADTEDYTRALSLGSLSALTVACWFKISADRNTWSSIFFIDSGQVDNWGMQTAEDGVTMNAVMDASTREGMGTLTVGTWYYACLATSGTTGNLYYKSDGGTLTTQSITGASAVTADTLRLGESPWGSEWLNGCLTAVKVWNVQLTAVEAQQESLQHLPHRTANLLAWYPLTQPDTKDYSGNGRTLSGGANTATEDGPKIGWRQGPGRLIIPTAAGGTTVTGVAVGAFGFTATANGVDRALGAAAGSFGFTGTANGVPRTFGTAAASFGFTGTAQGIDRALGVAAGSFGFTGTASGVPDVHGAAVGAFGFTATAQGVTGAPPVTGVATGAFGFTATTQGQPRTLGAAAGAFGFTSTAAGRPRVVAIALAAFGFTATATGQRETTGEAVVAFGFTATAQGLAIGPFVPGTAHAATGSAPTSSAATAQTPSASSGAMTVPTATGG